METGYPIKISNSKCRLGVYCCVLALLNVGFSVLLQLKVIVFYLSLIVHKYVNGKVCMLHLGMLEIMSRDKFMSSLVFEDGVDTD